MELDKGVVIKEKHLVNTDAVRDIEGGVADDEVTKRLSLRPSKRKRKDKKSFKTRLASIIMCGPISVWSVLFIILPIILLAFMKLL